MHELDALVRRGIALAAPGQQKLIREYGHRLKRAFMGRVDSHERAKPAQAARRLGLGPDYLAIADIAAELAEQHSTDGDLLAHGLSGQIHDVLMQRWREGGKVDRRPPQPRTIRRKLQRFDRLLLQQFPSDEDPKTEK
jgi:hypothetical protein